MNIVTPPMYNLSMSIVISEVTESGILVSADKRITDSKGRAYEDNCLKAFPVANRVVVGMTGKRVENPTKYKNILDRHSGALTDKTVKDCAKWIAEVMSDLHDLENDPPEIKLIVSGYDGNNPVIYEIHVTDEVGVPVSCGPYVVTNDRTHYEITDKSVNVVQKYPYNKTSYEKALKSHRSIIKETSKEEISVSEEFDSYLIKPSGIVSLG